MMSFRFGSFASTTTLLWMLLCLAVANVASGSIIQLTSQEFYDMATSGQVDLMIDVRTQDEWDSGHIENATFVPGLQTALSNTNDPEATLTQLNLWNCRYCRVVVYCRSGARAGAALDELLAAGFEGQLYNGQGVSQWTDAGYELVDDASVEDRPCMTATAEDTMSQQASVCVAAEEEPPLPIIRLTSQEFYDMATTGQVDIMIDVRSQMEWDSGHIENATFVPGLEAALTGSNDAEATLIDLNLWNCRFCRVVVYCRSGARAAGALDALQATGFEGQLYNGQGVSQWTDAGFELVNDPSVEDKACMTATEEDVTSAVSRQASVCVKEAPPMPPQQGEDGSSVTSSLDQMELDVARGLFLEQLHNATGYSFLFTLSCFCLPAGYPWVVTAEIDRMMMGIKDPNTSAPIMLLNPEDMYGIMGDTVLSAITTDGDDVLQMEDTYLNTFSILDLFDKIQEAINEPADEIRVVYHPEWGYPQDIYIDYNFMIADEEFIAFSSNLTLVDMMNLYQDESYFDMGNMTTNITRDGGMR